jgi:hypothetical protein
MPRVLKLFPSQLSGKAIAQKFCLPVFVIVFVCSFVGVRFRSPPEVFKAAIITAKPLLPRETRDGAATFLTKNEISFA